MRQQPQGPSRRVSGTLAAAASSSQQQWSRSGGQPEERRMRAAGAAGSWQDGGQRPRTATRGPPGPGQWAWPAQRGEAAPGGAATRWRGARRRRRQHITHIRVSHPLRSAFYTCQPTRAHMRGKVFDDPSQTIHVCDWYHTFANLAGVDSGSSIWTLLLIGNAAKRRTPACRPTKTP